MPRFRKWLAVFDNHGKLADPSAIEAMLEFKRHWKPDITIHGGDGFDLACLRKGASKDEEFEEVGADIDAGKDFLRKLRPNVYMRGNHCERLWDVAQGHNPIAARFATKAIEEILASMPKAQVFPYDKRAGVYQLGNLRFIHGYASGINAARSTAQAYKSVVMGHCHVIDSASVAGLEPCTGYIAGALCKLSAAYNRAHLNTLRQAHGFAYGITWPNGNYQYFQAQCEGGVWVFPSELFVVEPKRQVQLA
jgi:hypothetical protein